MMPFALNEATRFISPTKTLEYLAAGKPIVSTAIRDVVSPYGECGIVQIADQDTFPEAVDRALDTAIEAHHSACDQILERTSWDKTWAEMLELITGALRRATRANVPQKGDDSCSTISS
jgi:UDP-galactopyranose mutase